MTLMEELNAEKGQTFVIVTHDPGIGRRCHRLITMNDGLVTNEESR